jgi:hypothetical protein
MVTAAMLASRLLGKTGDPHWIPVAACRSAPRRSCCSRSLPDHTTLIIGLGFSPGSAWAR